MGRLLNTQTESLFNSIKNYGFQPQDFKLENLGKPTLISGNIFRFALIKNPEYDFCIEVFENGYETKQCPGISNYSSEYKPVSFGEVGSLFVTWLRDLKKELSTENYFEYYKNLVNEEPEILNENNKFTIDELKLLDQNIKGLKEGLKTLNLLPEQLEELNTKIDEVHSYAKDMKKVNWKELFYGAILGILFTYENGETIWHFIKNYFIQKYLGG